MENTNEIKAPANGKTINHPNDIRYKYMAIAVSYGSSYMKQERSAAKLWGWAFGFEKATDIAFFVWDAECQHFICENVQTFRGKVEHEIAQNFLRLVGNLVEARTELTK